MHFDHIVIGLGGMGSATLYELQRRGRRVLGLERFDIPNQLGSSHGLSRIIRLAYNEHPGYVPLLRRSYELWHRLEEEAGERLLVRTGGIDAGPREGRIVAGSLESCRRHGIEHEVASAAEVGFRYPGIELPPEFVAVLQSDAGYLRPERCVLAHVVLAIAAGAEVRGREPVLEWKRRGETFEVTTSKGTYEAPSLVVTAGPWAAKLLPRLGASAQPQRQVVGWFQPRAPELFVPERCPVFILDAEEGEYYGFPVDQQMPGFKIGRFFHRHENVDPDAPRRDADAEDEEVLRRAVRRYFPRADGPTLALQTCLFTMTPDRHFVLDRLEDTPGLVLGAGFSGHGFKFCTVVGEILADLAEAGRTRHDIEMFSLARFGASLTRGPAGAAPRDPLEPKLAPGPGRAVTGNT